MQGGQTSSLRLLRGLPEARHSLAAGVCRREVQQLDEGASDVQCNVAHFLRMLVRQFDTWSIPGASLCTAGTESDLHNTSAFLTYDTLPT